MKITKKRLYAVVVWYNVTCEVLDCINSYINDVERLVVVDNSSIDNGNLLRGYDNVEYVPNYDNLGIAVALNIGCKRAVEMGAEWILTMDQDSKFDAGEVIKFIDLANQYEGIDFVGIFAPTLLYNLNSNRHNRVNVLYQTREVVMTSGNILSAVVFLQSKGFKEEFFIDCVDDEYCYRIRKLGYNIVRINQVYLHHTLGKEGEIDILGKKIKFPIHNSIRRYYIFRNNLYLRDMYPEARKRCNRVLWRGFKRVLFYDWEDKIGKLKMMYKGYRDYKNNKKGRLEN